MQTITFLKLSDLLPSEEHDADKSLILASQILRQRTWNNPILVEEQFNVVMDGHHRLAAAKLLGLELVPVVLVNYTQVSLGSFRPEYIVSEYDIISRARAGNLYPYKTTRHMLNFEPPVCNCDIGQLKKGLSFFNHIDWVWEFSMGVKSRQRRSRYRVEATA